MSAFRISSTSVVALILVAGSPALVVSLLKLHCLPACCFEKNKNRACCCAIRYCFAISNCIVCTLNVDDICPYTCWLLRVLFLIVRLTVTLVAGLVVATPNSRGQRRARAHLSALSLRNKFLLRLPQNDGDEREGDFSPSLRDEFAAQVSTIYILVPARRKTEKDAEANAFFLRFQEKFQRRLSKSFCLLSQYS